MKQVCLVNHVAVQKTTKGLPLLKGNASPSDLSRGQAEERSARLGKEMKALDVKAEDFTKIIFPMAVDLQERRCQSFGRVK